MRESGGSLEMYVIAAKLIVDETESEQFSERMKKHAANSILQEGCLTFSVAVDNENKGVFHLWEVYEDAAAFDEHVNADFMAEQRKYEQTVVKESVVYKGTMIGCGNI